MVARSRLVVTLSSVGLIQTQPLSWRQCLQVTWRTTTGRIRRNERSMVAVVWPVVEMVQPVAGMLAEFPQERPQVFPLPRQDLLATNNTG